MLTHGFCSASRSGDVVDLEYAADEDEGAEGWVEDKAAIGGEKEKENENGNAKEDGALNAACPLVRDVAAGITLLAPMLTYADVC
jgi:hypothetical protein